MIGEIYEEALQRRGQVEVEVEDGHRRRLPIDDWLTLRPGDRGLIDRCHGATLDIGSGPGRFAVALARRDVLALGIDITPSAVALTLAAGGLALCRDVFGPVPGAGGWQNVLLADGNIGIGADPAALLRRAVELAATGGRILVEVNPPGTPSRTERVRLRTAQAAGDWFWWAHVSADDVGALAADCAAAVTELWEEAGRWFVALRA